MLPRCIAPLGRAEGQAVPVPLAVVPLPARADRGLRRGSVEEALTLRATGILRRIPTGIGLEADTMATLDTVRWHDYFVRQKERFVEGLGASGIPVRFKLN